MKKIIASIATLLTVCCAFAAPRIHFDQKKVNLGTIKANGGPVTFTYPFTNTGDEPLVIIKVSNGGCGCTTPTFPKEPIQPGKSGTISVTFDPTGRQGELNREIKVRSNAAKDANAKLRFTGAITPK